jgi:hypothetical protein
MVWEIFNDIYFRICYIYGMENNISSQSRNNGISSPNIENHILNPVVNVNKLLVLVSLITVFLLGATEGYWLGKNSNIDFTTVTPSTSNIRQKACTQEAIICPDGTSVGRTGPNCEFAPCPNTNVISQPPL